MNIVTQRCSRTRVALAATRLLASSAILWVASSSNALAAGSDEVAQTFLWVAGVLVAAKVGALFERIGQPAVLGEILMGVLIGNLALVGIGVFEPIESNLVVGFLAQLGVVILLFQIGLESDVAAFRKVGARSFGVAVVGVVAPFVLGAYMVGPWLLPGLTSNAYLFLGAALTATSVGITGRVFRDMGAIKRPEAQIVLGAAVIDDVLGLIILSVVASIATRGAVTPAEVLWITVQSIGFLALAIGAGHFLAPQLSRLFAAIDPGPGSKLIVALVTCLVLAYLAHAIGLAPIVGAFAAGLILDEVKLKAFERPALAKQLVEAVRHADEPTRRRILSVVDGHSHRHLEHMLEPIGHLLVPVFFVLAGMQVRLDLLFDPRILALSLGLAVAAVCGKLVAGAAAGSANRWVVGWGMVPRGEVGLIFAFVGKSIGVVTDELFSVIVLMVMFTTLITPPVLGSLLRRESTGGRTKAAVNHAVDGAR